MTTPTAPPNYSDLTGFAADYHEIGAIVWAESRQVDLQTYDDSDRMAVIADNWVAATNLARALGLLFDTRNLEGANVVFRAFYETCVNFLYLHVGDRTRNALLARAYALQEMAETYATAADQALATALRRQFDSMPEAIRTQLAQNRQQERNHWSGVSLAARAKALGLAGHRVMYRGVSWDAHALALGRLPLKPIGEDRHEIVMERRLSEKDANSLARVARLLLRAVWARFSKDLTGAVRPLSAPPPDPRSPRA